ncbi:hypothetical protein E3T26_06970 [Cryobacterium sp. TMT1-21]|uniref:terminase small subunit n=1 Tax=Cryobacterium sp. TMT1-21 TaxID=1259234 RepID=UPI0010698626|nr:terminase small subunit [Cryobacterium sp. TMT1-21]TFD15518.1 hypothetical protein E3T26_06970 [Cryobacterium sp. TMT1-21]
MSKPKTPVTKQPKHPGGRPLAFATVDALEQAINSYFSECDPHLAKRMTETGTATDGSTMFGLREVMTEQKPYTMSGLARHMEIDRKTLLNYSKIEQYFPTVEAARERVHEFAEAQLYGKSSGGAQFVLKNNFDWKDRSEVDLTTKDQPLAMVEFIGGGSTTNSQDPVS